MSYDVTDALASVLTYYDYSKGEFYDRLGGLTDGEYWWEPVPGCWTVTPTDDGWTAANDPEADPAPFTTIAWRLWHLWDCFESYSERAFDSRASGMPYDRFVGSAVEAVALVRRAIDHFVAELEASGPDAAEPLGPDFGPFAERNRIDLGLHAMRELQSHGAEIALLRDLWRTSEPPTA
ncbi:MAG: DinB family protein [Actinomycetota bacterium]